MIKNHIKKKKLPTDESARQILTLSVNSSKCKIFILFIFLKVCMYIAYLSLGSNLNDPHNQIKSAIKEINNLSNVTLVKQSSLYQTPPIGPKQPDFINAALKIKTSLSPHELLSAMQTIEQAHHRVREIHWGPRTLDIDVLLYENLSINSEKLTIPHPFMDQRAFVLIPLLEIAPELTTTQHGVLAEILQKLPAEDKYNIRKID